MRRMVAMSLDGYISGPNGEADWTFMDPDIDFDAMFRECDAFLIGRKTYEPMAKAGQGGQSARRRTFVVSRTLPQRDHPNVTIISDKVEETIASLKNEKGKEIGLFGGGTLFRSLLDAKLVDKVEVAVIPVLLGNGVPLLPSRTARTKLTLVNHQVLKKTGIVALDYDVQ